MEACPGCLGPSFVAGVSLGCLGPFGGGGGCHILDTWVPEWGGANSGDGSGRNRRDLVERLEASRTPGFLWKDQVLNAWVAVEIGPGFLGLLDRLEAPLGPWAGWGGRVAPDAWVLTRPTWCWAGAAQASISVWATTPRLASTLGGTRTSSSIRGSRTTRTQNRSSRLQGVRSEQATPSEQPPVGCWVAGSQEGA